jgi:benzylsuccinate CoA-transferase BbsF subunit
MDSVMEIFEGLKIVDFSWVIVGPTVTQELAQFGAQVIHVESHRYPDIGRLIGPFKNNMPGIDNSAWFAVRNANKYGISLDLNKEKGREIAFRLVSWADVVCESMAPGKMARWGLDYESCKRIKEDIIYFSTSQFGQKGPLSPYAGYGQLGAAYSGLTYLVGKKGRPPIQLYNNYPDFIAPYYMIATLVAALIMRKRTGKGIYLDQSQVEAGITFMGPAILDYLINGRLPEPQENRDPEMAPHGVFPCKGDDVWIAIAIRDENEWEKLIKLMGEPDWARDKKFSTLELRKENEYELNEMIGLWTSKFDVRELMIILQKEGIPAGIVATGEDLLNDPQLKYREHFVYLNHTVIGRHAYQAPSYRLSKTPHKIKKPAPCLGEDNLYVFREILKLTDDDISDLIAEGVITTEADLPEIKTYR